MVFFLPIVDGMFLPALEKPLGSGFALQHFLDIPETRPLRYK
jgi:hypothetical protein